jgi:hypothetical protein
MKVTKPEMIRADRNLARTEGTCIQRNRDAAIIGAKEERTMYTSWKWSFVIGNSMLADLIL